MILTLLRRSVLLRLWFVPVTVIAVAVVIRLLTLLALPLPLLTLRLWLVASLLWFRTLTLLLRPLLLLTTALSLLLRALPVTTLAVLALSALFRLLTLLPLLAPTLRLLLSAFISTTFLFTTVLFQRLEGYLAYVVHEAHVHFQAGFVTAYFQFYRLQFVSFLAIPVLCEYFFNPGYGERVLLAAI